MSISVKKLLIKLINSIVPKSNNQVVFVDGRLYPDNIYALVQELVSNPNKRNFKNISVVFIGKTIPYEKIENVDYYLYPGLTAFWRVFRAKYIVMETLFGDDYLSKRQVLINTWHGIALKKVLSFTNEYKDRTKPFASYALSYSSYFNSIVSKAFLIDQHNVIPSGSPRNDFFFKGDKSDLSKALKRKIDGHKIIMWMPTYRQSTKAHSNNDGAAYEYGIPFITEDNIVQLDSVLQNKRILLIVKFHMLQDLHKQISRELKNIVFLTSQDVCDSKLPLYQIVGKCDALITDYSSIFFEFLSLDKTICFAYDDFDEYNSKRGFMFDNPKDLMPGYHVNDFSGLLDFLSDFSEGKDASCAIRDEAIDRMHIHMDSQNSKRFLREIGFIKDNNYDE